MVQFGALAQLRLTAKDGGKMGFWRISTFSSLVDAQA
jgi:hypothetical protein